MLDFGASRWACPNLSSMQNGGNRLSRNVFRPPPRNFVPNDNSFIITSLKRQRPHHASERHNRCPRHSLRALEPSPRPLGPSRIAPPAKSRRIQNRQWPTVLLITPTCLPIGLPKSAIRTTILPPLIWWSLGVMEPSTAAAPDLRRRTNIASDLLSVCPKSLQANENQTHQKLVRLAPLAPRVPFYAQVLQFSHFFLSLR